MVSRVGNRYVWQSEQTENQGGQFCPGQTKIFLVLHAEFYLTNVCPPWPETLPAPLIGHTELIGLLAYNMSVRPTLKITFTHRSVVF